MSPSKRNLNGLSYLVLQVEPLLEVLVGSTLEQGLMEVLQEEELAAMRSQQQRFEQVGWTVGFLQQCGAPAVQRLGLAVRPKDRICVPSSRGQASVWRAATGELVIAECCAA